jgi:protocatechuate 3,4-dioxygenase beta subunit
MQRLAVALSTACALTILVGQITDRTTGQPLRGVQVQVRQGTSTLRAVSDESGRFTLSGVHPGVHVVRYGSNDVPPARVSVSVHGTKQLLHIKACSTTLDYSCAGPGAGGG